MGVKMLLRFILFVIGIHYGVTTSNNLQTCKNTKVEENVTLRGGIGAGTFKKLAKVTSMASCVELCCKNPSCDVAFMSGLKCYAVECVSDDECESTATDTSETKVLIAHVRTGKNKGNKSFALAGIPTHHTLATKASLAGSPLSSKPIASNAMAKGLVSSGMQTPNLGSVNPQPSASGKQTSKTPQTPVKINPGMAGQCKPGKVHKEVTLKGGINAGNYKDIGAVASVEECSKKCCGYAQCDLAFVLQNRCYLVGCTDGKNCQLQKAKSSRYHPSVVYVTRWNNEGVKHTVSINDDTSSNFMCSPMKLMTKVTLKGGLKAGDFTDTGKVGNIGECYDLCCKQPTCNLAFMLGQNCFSVKCYNKDLCSTIPAQPSIYNPQIAYVWNRKEMAPKGKESSTKKTEITKPAPACPKAKVIEEVTLVGGLGAGNFHDNGKVKDMQQCQRICCEMPKCNLAFMLSANCFSVECKNAALCKTQKARPSKFSPHISFVRSFGSTKFMSSDEAMLAAKPVIPPAVPAIKKGSIATPGKPIEKPKPSIPGLPESPSVPGMPSLGLANNQQAPGNPNLPGMPPLGLANDQQTSSIPKLPGMPPLGLSNDQQASLNPNLPGNPSSSGMPGIPGLPGQPLEPAPGLNKPQAEPVQGSNLLSLPGQPNLPQLPPGLPVQTLKPQPSQVAASMHDKPPLDMQNPLLPQQPSVPGSPIMPSSPGLPNQQSPSQALGMMSPQPEEPLQPGQGLPFTKPDENTEKKTGIMESPETKQTTPEDLLKTVNLTSTITDAKPGQAMKMNIVDGKLQLTPMASSKHHKSGSDESKTNSSGSSAGAFDAILGGGQSSEDNKCMTAKVITDVTLKGGKKAGKFKDHGDVKNMKACKKLCCKDDSCNLAFMLEKTCYTVTCKNKDLCDYTAAPPSDFRPRISYVRPLKDSIKEMADLPAIPKAPNNLRCRASNITNDKTFKGEITSNNYTLQQDATDMARCMARCCQSKNCDVAYYVDNKCYSVTCTNKGACIPVDIKGKPKSKIPLISAMLTKPKEEEDEVTDLAADVDSPKSSVSDDVTNLQTTKERCRSNRISTGITLRNGNRGSNFTSMGQVGSLKKCITLCCVRPSCDIAYLENNKCFAVQCNDGVMCQTNAHEADMGMNVKLAYMDRHKGKVKERDWMIVYIIVGSLAFAAVIGGVIWGVCICTKNKNKMGKQRRLLDDEDDEDDEMLPKPTQTRYRTPMHRY